MRGNHCFVDLKPLFDDGSREIYEFLDEPSVFIHAGLRFGGFRGVPTINGCWADENTERVLGIKCEVLGPVDVLVTHGAAYGYADWCKRRVHLGSKAQRTFLDHGGARVHLFGHIHEGAGQQVKNRILLSNAATQVNVVEI